MIRYYCYALTIALAICGCGSDSGIAPLRSPVTAFWELRLNHHAVQLSLRPPYNVLQLHATPYMANGEVWAPAGISSTEIDSLLAASPAVFISRDSSKVLVSRNGMVSARAVQAGNVYVVATRELGEIVQVDSALVRVADVASPPVLKTFTIGPNLNDSAKVAVGTFGTFAAKTLIVTAKDTNNTNITNLPVYVTSVNPLIAVVAQKDKWAATKRVTAVRPGGAGIRAETWVYGITMIDTVEFTVGYPLKLGGFVDYSNDICWGPEALFYKYLTVGPGAVVGWTNETMRSGAWGSCELAVSNAIPIDIIFEDPINVLPALQASQNSGGGNILAIPGDTTVSVSGRRRFRRFLKPGTYTYRIEPLGLNGTIVVKNF